MVNHFLYEVCGFTGSYNLADRQAKCIEYIKETVGDRKVLVSVFCQDIHDQE